MVWANLIPEGEPSSGHDWLLGWPHLLHGDKFHIVE
jgi:hypothetical protein